MSLISPLLIFARKCPFLNVGLLLPHIKGHWWHLINLAPREDWLYSTKSNLRKIFRVDSNWPSFGHVCIPELGGRGIWQGWRVEQTLESGFLCLNSGSVTYQLCHTWHLTFLCLSFLVCGIRITVRPISQAIVKIKSRVLRITPTTK